MKNCIFCQLERSDRSRFTLFDRKIVRKIDRKLPENHFKNLQNTSLKLLPNTRKLLINPGWLISNFRVFGGSFREAFWRVLTCFSESFRSIFRTNFRSNRVNRERSVPRFGTSPAGYIYSFWWGIRIWGPKCKIPSSRGKKKEKTPPRN